MFASFCSGPPSPNAYVPIQYAIQLSMIVVITSCAPTVAFRIPAIPAQTAPASIASTIARSACGIPGMPAQTEPTQTATIAPIVYWPCPPMLNSPQRNANATASPVRISGVVTSSVCWRLNSASDSLVRGEPREEPVQAGALEDPLVRRDRVVAGRRTTIPPMKKASTVVISGVTIPPARW